jgi:hypothetical protein
MDVETPSGGRDRTEIDQSLCTREEEDVPPEAPRQELRPRGMTPFQWNVGLGRPRTSPFDHDVIQPMDVLEADWAAVARVACWRSPRRANVLLQDVSFALERANASLRGAFTLFSA